MAPPRAEAETLRHLHKEDLDKAMDYESDTNFIKANGFSLSPPLRVKTTLVVHKITFRERGAADTLTAFRFSPDIGDD